MEIYPPDKFPSKRTNADWFTGVVWQDPIIDAPPPARVRATRVSFEPGARTNWHTHPLGQTLHVLSGVCLIQVWGGKAHAVMPGGTIWIPPGEKHWHGATATKRMVHLAIHEADEKGSHVHWLEPVTEEQFLAALSSV